jgi:hypothetical protein
MNDDDDDDEDDAHEKNFECRRPVYPVVLLCHHNKYIAVICLWSDYMMLSMTDV